MAYKKNAISRIIVHAIVVVFVTLILSACKGTGNGNVKKLIDSTSVHEVLEEQVVSTGINFDSAAIDQFIKENAYFAKYKNNFLNFYRNRQFQHVWYNESGLSETAQAILSRLGEISGSADTSLAVHIQQAGKLVHTEDEEAQKPGFATPDSRNELLLTGLFFEITNNLVAGKVSEEEMNKLGWYIPRKKIQYANLLDSFLVSKSWNNVEETSMGPLYKKLQSALAGYQKIKAEDEVSIPRLTGKQNRLITGDSSNIIGPLYRRMKQLGITGPVADTVSYSYELTGAVNRAKKNYGFKQDSVIDNKLIEQLNVPVSERIKKILVNLERMRWLPKSSGYDEAIFVNIPEFKLHYYKNKQEVWSCNVVTGKTLTKTVIFSGLMQTVVLSPYWYVPPSIINKEVKPGMARNPGYLARHNMEWNGGQVRQKPGPGNSLGRVKFLFPNSNNIYLHDTPAKSLFTEDSRAYSHGCVRVGEPYELAVRVLSQMPEWTPEKIRQGMESGKEKQITLSKKIPVVIGYFTAFIDLEGDLNFRNDIYDRDKKLLNTLSL